MGKEKIKLQVEDLEERIAPGLMTAGVDALAIGDASAGDGNGSNAAAGTSLSGAGGAHVAANAAPVIVA